MDDRNPPLGILVDLEARQEDLLRRIDELDRRVRKVLAECLPPLKKDACTDGGALANNTAPRHECLG